jgi:hypothetical protein
MPDGQAAVQKFALLCHLISECFPAAGVRWGDWHFNAARTANEVNGHTMLQHRFYFIQLEAQWQSVLWKWNFQGNSKLYSQDIHNWSIPWEILIQICLNWIWQQNILRQLESSIIIFWARIMKRGSKRVGFYWIIWRLLLCRPVRGEDCLVQIPTLIRAAECFWPSTVFMHDE